MKIKLIVSLACVTVISASAIAAVKPKVSTPEEKAARAERRLKALNATGGFIADPRNASGKYCFINCVKDLKDDVLKAAAIKCQNSCLILTEVKNEKMPKFGFAEADQAFRKSGGLMATFLIDEDDWPLQLVCPEKRWVVVNVRQLKTDKPNDEVYNARVRKMMSRSLGQLFQAGYAFSSVSTMNLISSAQDLDRIATEGLATECTTVVNATAAKFGFSTMKRILYRKAVEEGWAPPPVNSFQKSAWDQVHATPKNPMKIEFDPKKGR